MKGLFLKDYFNLIRNSKLLFTTLIFYGIFAITMNSPSFVIGIIIFVFSMMVLTSFSYDDLAKWNIYAMTMPISRSSFILEKYCLSLALVLFGSLSSILITFITCMVRSLSIKPEWFLTAFVVSEIALIFISIMIPLIYKFGTEKSRIMLILIMAVPFMLAFVLFKANIPMPSDNFIKGLMFASPVITLASLFLSYNISISIFSKKDL
ncbi:MAG: ABC-2 transporter permease [Bacillota bacterium]|nr:ABC-2 transporter permease [Bacillota bacterium]